MNKSTFTQLNPEQQFWYANIMIDMVMADGLVHPFEQKYLALIYTLFADRPQLLSQLKEKSQRASTEKPQPIKGLSQEQALLIIQDCVDTAIADAEFHKAEEKLIYEVGKALNCSLQEIDTAVARGKRLLGHLFSFAS